jgi:hypothetical protein
VIEVSVNRIDPGRPPRLVLDMLVNPRRRVAATEIHGITDAHVENQYCPKHRSQSYRETHAPIGQRHRTLFHSSETDGTRPTGGKRQ